jgi:hypothetical protein
MTTATKQTHTPISQTHATENLTGAKYSHEELLKEIDRLTKQRRELLEALDVAAQGLIEHFGAAELSEFPDLIWARVIVDRAEAAIRKAKGEA